MAIFTSKITEKGNNFQSHLFWMGSSPSQSYLFQRKLSRAGLVKGSRNTWKQKSVQLHKRFYETSLLKITYS